MSGTDFTTDRRGAIAVTAGATLAPMVFSPALAATALPTGALRVGRDQAFDKGPIYVCDPLS